MRVSQCSRERDTCVSVSNYINTPSGDSYPVTDAPRIQPLTVRAYQVPSPPLDLDTVFRSAGVSLFLVNGKVLQVVKSFNICMLFSYHPQAIILFVYFFICRVYS